MEEIEVKFLNIDKLSLEKKLLSLGAKKVGDFFYKRYVFDYPDLRLNAKGAWIRLRDEGTRITLGYKERLGRSSHGGNDKGMKEMEIEVNDFEKTRTLLKSIGLIEKFYEENRRSRWVKDTITFDIDTWPALQPYLEIEAHSWPDVDQGIALLGLNPNDKKIFSTFQVYELSGINELDYEKIAFDGLVKKN